MVKSKNYSKNNNKKTHLNNHVYDSINNIDLDFNKLVLDNDNLPTQSDEQNEILLNFLQGNNIKVEAIAGSGKTTTLLLLARAAKKELNIKSLILTYNKDLQTEIKTRLRQSNLANYCSVYTYHGYASRIYQTVINTDVLLRKHLVNEPSISTEYDVILLDEVQDMSPDYYKLVSKIVIEKRIVLVGDRRQCINEYLGATANYLINYKKYFPSDRPWKELMLKTSYRMTPAIANFVNKNILKDNLIIGGNIKNENVLPIYNYSTWNISDLIATVVHKYGPEEVVIMTASTKNISPNSPIGRLIENDNRTIKFCHRENEPLEGKVMAGKVLISSFNAMKGKEKKCVVVVGFDESYFEYYNKEWSKENILLPNIIYVAATRAKQALILIQDDKKTPFRTTNRELIKETCQVMGEQDTPIHKKMSDRKYVVTELTRHRNTTDMIDLLNMIKINIITAPSKTLMYEKYVEFNTYYEDMTTYYGTLIPMIADFKLNGVKKITLYDMKGIPENIVEKFNMLNVNKYKTLKEWMQHVVLQHVMISGHYFYAEQILNYDWVDENFINEASDRIVSIISKGEFNYGVARDNLSGEIDYITDTEIWEFKCSLSLNEEYYIQCAAYIALYALSKGKLLPSKLFNARTGELVEITIDNPALFIDIFMRNNN